MTIENKREAGYTIEGWSTDTVGSSIHCQTGFKRDNDLVTDFIIFTVNRYRQLFHTEESTKTIIHFKKR